ncbi:MAG: hypothetical protein EHM72_04820, partial [Calditrichaeota bacterium]
MQKGLITKTIFVFILLILAVYSLYPTFQFGDLQKKEIAQTNKIQSLTNLTKGDIEEGLVKGNLEAKIHQVAGETSPQQETLSAAKELLSLNNKVNRVERRSIKLGLDLQGGTYLVYEADLPKLLRTLAKNQDERLNEIIDASQAKVEQEGLDFFVVLVDNFRERDVEMNRYFGRKGETNDKIVEDLKREAEDAVDRTLEVLRNRIDQFGVSEPMLTKQGSN